MERIKANEPVAGHRDGGVMASCWSECPPAMKRPAWLNWLYLLIFLWSSWQLAGIWWQRLHG
ncbi:hypothetical protein BV53_06895 [Candidatus Synechococcus spongiarum LMB bulk15N]|uniref:Uncharacterized protein n=1 Tax=Candidatus Synechococcus spongiarum LMB bulk15N TaxID=1943583 RepID=A0A1T1CYU7_9SYNE|nr:hypothetical protein BV53_06895 [Candidatus Synechococcus spongiarum LMB bulk15N]